MLDPVRSYGGGPALADQAVLTESLVAQGPVAHAAGGRAAVDEALVDHAVVEHTLALVGNALADRTVAIERLRAYYAPDSDHVGASFLDGTENEHPETVLPADLFAVGMLDLQIRPAAARRLLHDTRYSRRIEACLSAAALPLDVELADAEPAVLHAMLELHDAVLAAVDPGPVPAESSRVVAGAICARKRPELFCVLEPGFCAALRLPGPAHPAQSWQLVRHVLRHDGVAGALAELWASVRGSDRGLPVDVYPLRQLHVLICHA